MNLYLETCGHLKLEYGYDNLLDIDRYVQHVIWKYNYLNLRTEGKRAKKYSTIIGIEVIQTNK